MANDELRGRLERLNGGPLRETPTCLGAGTAGRARQHRRSDRDVGAAPLQAGAPSAPQSFSVSAGPGLERWLPGRALSTAGGECWLVERSLEEAASWATPAFVRVMSAWGLDLGRNAARIAGCALAGLHQLLFVDLETTGLGSCPLFLIGTLQWDNGALVVRQYFARHPGEERASLTAYAAMAAGYPGRVTYNGKSFDEPFLARRATAHSVRLRPAAGHLDLIKPARQHYKGRLSDCRLQTLEMHLCGRTRTGDIPGREIPGAYADFVRTSDGRLMASVLEHNRLDLLTMLDLMDRVPLGISRKPRRKDAT